MGPPTGEHGVAGGRCRDGVVVERVLHVARLAAAAAAEEDDRLVVARRQHGAVRRLRRRVHVRRQLLRPTAPVHLHHLQRDTTNDVGWSARQREVFSDTAANAGPYGTCMQCCTY